MDARGFLKKELKGLEVYEGQKEMNISIDPGSRSVRSIVYELGEKDAYIKGNNIQVPVIDSKYGVTELNSEYGVTQDALDDYMSSTEYTLEDNLEVYIEDITLDKDDSDKMFKNIRFVKEVLKAQTKLSGERVSTTETKSNQTPTFVNVVNEIGLKHILEYSSGKIPSVCKPKITVALPPSDTKSNLAKDRFRTRLAGLYNYALTRYGVSIQIDIRPENILIVSEPEAALRFYISKLSDPTDDTYTGKISEILKSNTFIVDGGGSTTDTAYLENGKLIANGSKHGDFGGFMVEQRLIEKLTTIGEFTKLSEEDAKFALMNGYIVSGNHNIPVVKFIDSAKKPVAKKVYQLLQDVIALNGKRFSAIQNIIFCGRMFGTTNYAEEHSRSMADIVMEAYKKNSKYTDFIVLKEQFPIPEGLAWYEISRRK